MNINKNIPTIVANRTCNNIYYIGIEYHLNINKKISCAFMDWRCFYPNYIGLNKTLSKNVVWTISKHSWFLQRPYVLKKEFISRNQAFSTFKKQRNHVSKIRSVSSIYNSGVVTALDYLRGFAKRDKQDGHDIIFRHADINVRSHR